MTDPQLRFQYSRHGLILAILDVLIRQATQKEPLPYQQLCEEIRWGAPVGLGSPLGALNNELSALGKAWGEQIPPISVLVVKKGTDLPSAGFAEFIRPPLTPSQYDALSPPARRHLVAPIRQAVYQYKKWRKVRKALA